MFPRSRYGRRAKRETWREISPNFGVLLLVLGCGIWDGCSSHPERQAPAGLVWSSIRQQVQEAAASVIAVEVESQFRIEVYHHQIVNGSVVRDPTSSTGFLLLKGKGGVTSTVQNQEVYGGGVVLFQELRHSLVLTSRHLVVIPDTVATYYQDSLGNPTNLLYSRVIKTRSVVRVIVGGGLRRAADVVTTDSVSDLALLAVETGGAPGIPFPLVVAYHSKIEWGELVFAFGCPRGVKQLAVGVTSPSPYPGTFSLDAATRFGFSGGPVLRVNEHGQLELAGIIRGAQVNRLQYVSPPPGLLPGQYITGDDLNSLKVDEYNLVDYGVAFAIDAESIGEFFKESIGKLESRGIHLPGRLLPP